MAGTSSESGRAVSKSIFVVLESASFFYFQIMIHDIGLSSKTRNEADIVNH